MRGFWQKLLPPQASNDYRGSKTASVVFLVLAVVSLIRSLIHIFAPDGGAGSIAGLDLAVSGAQGIVLAFSLWGGAQLITACVQLVVWFRYRNLLPLMYVLLILEYLLRILAGIMKPAQFAHVPPGQIANYAIPMLAVVMLVMTLIDRKKPGEKADT